MSFSSASLGSIHCCPEQIPRPAREPDLAVGQLAGAADLGVRPEKAAVELSAAAPTDVGGLILAFLPVFGVF